MRSLQNIKDMLYEELERMSEGGMSASSLDAIHKMVGAIKNIYKIEMFEDVGYSRDEGMSYNSYGGGSYEGGGSYGGNSYGGSSYDGGGGYSSRSKHYVRGHYSRDDGRRHMIEQLGGMMRSAGSDKEREAIRKCIDMIENA